MRIQVANAPVSWGIMEVKGWSPPLPHGTFLDELRIAGYEGTELGPYGYLPVDPEQLAGELKRRSLLLLSAFVPLRLKDPEMDLRPLEAVGRLLSALGARHIVLADALWPEREAVAGRAGECDVRLTDREWQRAAANVQAASQSAAGFGLRCVFHPHVGTYIETPDETGQLLGLANVGLCLDTGHCAYGGGDPVAAVKKFGERVEYLHFKDVDPRRLEQARRKKLGFLEGVRAGVFCPLGAGCVQFPELLNELQRIDYNGWAVVEQDVDPQARNGPSPLQCARESRAYLRDRLGI